MKARIPLATTRFRDVRQVIGVDGCRAGWIAVFRSETALDYRICADIAAVAALLPDAAGILIDIPIGLPWLGCPVRPCEMQARAWLRPYGRAASVFSPPCREAAHAGSYREACARNQVALGKQLSMQTWNICAKIAEVDRFLQSGSGPHPPLREAHPEVCFAALNGGPAMSAPKKTADGAAERLAVLSRHVHDAEALVMRVLREHRRSVVLRDDVIDALACYATAQASVLCSLVGEPRHDLCGLPMEMVYAEV